MNEYGIEFSVQWSANTIANVLTELENKCGIQVVELFLAKNINSTSSPLKNVRIKYKKKSQVIKYKKYLIKDEKGNPEVCCFTHGVGNISEKSIENIEEFIKWIDEDWQEIEL